MADGYEEGYESDGASNITMCYNYATSYGYNTKQASSWCIAGLVGSADGEVNVTTSYYPNYGNNTYFKGVYFNNSTGTVSPTSKTLSTFANRSTYTGFDFTNDWVMDTGEYGGALLRETPDHTHYLSYYAAYDYTCTSSGRIAHWYCANCDTYYRDSGATKVISADEIYPPAAHDYGEWYVYKAATCTAVGEKRSDCSGCDLYYSEIIPMIAHSYAAVVTPPTCTEAGYTTYTCSCGDTYTADEVAANGHSYTSVVTPPTCTEAGYTTYTCSCGDTYTADEVASNGHSFGDWYTVTEATCTEDGEERRDCAACDHYETNVLTKTGHSYTSVVTPPTCTEAGYTTYTCSCGDTYTADEVASNGHSFGDWYTVTDATCTEDGEERRDCAACDHYETNVLTKTGHSYTSVVTPPTCTEAGYTTYTCSCGDTYTADEVASNGHSFGAWKTTKEATCTEAGNQTRSCKNCNHSETETIAAKGHSYASKVTKPTCTEAGYTTHTCKNCSHSYKSNTTKATGHSFTKYVSNGDATLSADGTKTAKCDHGCGATKTVTDPGSKLLPTTITSDVYHVAGGYISGISAGTTASKLLDGINEDGVRIMNGTKTVAAGEKVGTGMTAQLVVKGKVADEVTIVVTGDTNGDGNITVTDMLAIKSHILKKKTLTGAAALAADVSGDGGISVTDFIQAKSHILGKSSVKAQKAVFKAL